MAFGGVDSVLAAGAANSFALQLLLPATPPIDRPSGADLVANRRATLSDSIAAFNQAQADIARNTLSSNTTPEAARPTLRLAVSTLNTTANSGLVSGLFSIRADNSPPSLSQGATDFLAAQSLQFGGIGNNVGSLFNVSA